MQADLFDYKDTYPHAPGHRGVDTSKAAADDLKLKVGTIRERVYQAIVDAGWRGLTTEEICEATGIRYATAQPRTAELQKQGFIRDSLARRLNGSKKQARVWIAT